MSFRQTLDRFLGGGQGGVYLGPGTTGRMKYIQPFIENPEAGQYDLEEDEAVERWGDSNRVVAKDAPEGVKRNLLGLLDWATFGVADFDRRGNLYGGVHQPGLRPGSGYGGQAELEPDRIPNPNYPGNPNLPGAGPVPYIDPVSRWGNTVSQDLYTGWRDQRRLNTYLDMASSRLKDANYYAYQLDKAQMYDYMNSPRGQAETALTQQQAMATPRLAKAALIEARAKSQQAANEFGQLGLQRTYTPGIG